MNDTEDKTGLYDKNNRRDDAFRRVGDEEVTDDLRELDERRIDDDRRGYYLNVTGTDEQFYGDMITWLMENGEEEWTIGSNENEPDDSAVTCRVRFESTEKLTEFEAWLDDKRKTS